MPIYAPGYPGKCAFEPTGGAFTAINVTGWDSALKVDSLDTTGSGSGGIEERIAGLFRGTFNFNANFDLANYYFGVTPGVVAGVKGLLQLYVSAAKFYQYPVMVTDEPVKSVVSGKIEYTITAGLDSSSGAIVRPV